MSHESDIKVPGAGLVGGAIASALLETLLEKNVLTLNEVRATLDRAMQIASRHSGTPALRHSGTPEPRQGMKPFKSLAS